MAPGFTCFDFCKNVLHIRINVNCVCQFLKLLIESKVLHLNYASVQFYVTGYREALLMY